MTPTVVCLGLATLDTIAAVPRWPRGNDRVVASELVLAGGGPAATAAVALARLGVPVAFVGAVGEDDVGERIRGGLAAEGVDVAHLRIVRGARSPQSTILVSGGERAIAAYPGTLPPLRLDDRAAALCRAAAWVHVDHVGYAAAPAGVRLSLDGGNPIDGLELRGVSLYVPTERALREAFGSAENAVAAGAELVVLTRGAAGSAAYTADGWAEEVPARDVDVVSTLGAGDVFHGALLAQLVQERPLREALERANECAALSCRALDGRSAIPTLAEVGR